MTPIFGVCGYKSPLLHDSHLQFLAFSISSSSVPAFPPPPKRVEHAGAEKTDTCNHGELDDAALGPYSPPLPGFVGLAKNHRHSWGVESFQ